MPMVVDLARVQTGSIETVAVENLPNSGLNNCNFVADLCLLKIYNPSQSRWHQNSTAQGYRIRYNLKY